MRIVENFIVNSQQWTVENAGGNWGQKHFIKSRNLKRLSDGLETLEILTVKFVSDLFKSGYWGLTRISFFNCWKCG